MSTPTYTPTPLNESNAPHPVPRHKRGAGGTPGGIGTFLIGLVLAAAGTWLITNQVTVTSSFSFFGFSRQGTFGLTMVPLLVGIGLLFFNGKSIAGWIVTIAGAAMILAAVLMNLQIFWRPTSLFNTIMMWGMLAAGLGMVFRSLRAYPPPAR